ncbi:GDSL esterase/lipase At5g62930 isoform X2 [Cryptomeria japonica]|uniref:GDSL esterase/lipase At5g62930 isoform X2 n=1 Tax=Cryptomeria japonica TaxID=3369 RepID=UPI0027DA1CC8|nr:GDSL esterase/lipase At5g62930 isoform X2 [Cryptomeria japonica]
MRPQFVLFGDSITARSFGDGGWGASLVQRYSRKADVVLRGYGGYNTRWALFLLPHIFPLESLKQPSVVTVFFGANDAALLGRSNERQHVPLTEYMANLHQIITHLKKCSSSMLIMLITPPPVDEKGRKQYARSLVLAHPRLLATYGENAVDLPERTNEVAGAYAKSCLEVASEASIPVVDLWSRMQETPEWQHKYLSDGLHLTPDGNAIVFEEVLKILNARAYMANSKKEFIDCQRLLCILQPLLLVHG